MENVEIAAPEVTVHGMGLMEMIAILVEMIAIGSQVALSVEVLMKSQSGVTQGVELLMQSAAGATTNSYDFVESARMCVYTRGSLRCVYGNNGRVQHDPLRALGNGTNVYKGAQHNPL